MFLNEFVGGARWVHMDIAGTLRVSQNSQRRSRYDTYVPPEFSKLEAAALGFRALSKDDFDNMRMQFPTYDALYKYCQLKVEGTEKLGHAAL